VSAACDLVQARLAAYGRDELCAEDRRAFREHLRSCARCRTAAVSEDPSLLFASVAEAEGHVDSAEVASLVSSVRAAIAWKEAERRVSESSRPDRSDRRRRGRIAAAAAVVFLTLAVPSGLRSPAPEPQSPTGSPAGRVSAAAAPAATVKTSGGATVYDWTPGAGEPRVVWIVDGSLDI